MKNKVVLIFFIIGILVLQGCSNNSPSQSEIETAILNYYSKYKNCKGISIENVEKKNGIIINDNNYKIIAGYDIRIIPVEGGEEFIDLDTKVKHLDKEISPILSENYALITQLQTESAPYYSSNKEEDRSRLAAITQQINELQLNKKVAALDQLRTTLSVKSSEKIKQLKEQWGSDECLGFVQYRLDNLFFEKWAHAITSGSVNSFERTFNMVKSENGWIESK